jgi:hypothetical protein
VLQTTAAPFPIVSTSSFNSHPTIRQRKAEVNFQMLSTCHWNKVSGYLEVSVLHIHRTGA